MPDPTGGLVAASVIGGVSQASAANKAANAQKSAAKDQIAYSEDTRDMILERLDPFYESGVGAQNALASLYGLGEAPEGFTGFEASPGYQFRMQEGVNALEGSAAARGGLFSGNTARAITDYGQNVASNEYNNWLAGLSGLAGSGQNAASGGASALTNTNTAVGNALSNYGNAAAAGAVGVGNALSGFANNAVGLIGYQNYLNQGVTPQAQANAFSQGGGLY